MNENQTRPASMACLVESCSDFVALDVKPNTGSTARMHACACWHLNIRRLKVVQF